MNPKANPQVDDILDQVEALVQSAQKDHFNSFLRSGSVSYTELSRNLMSLSRVVGRVHNALKLVEEGPHFTD